MMAVPVSTSGSTFRHQRPQPLFEADFAFGDIGRNYDVAADGRFLMLENAEDEPARMVVVQNWVRMLD